MRRCKSLGLGGAVLSTFAFLCDSTLIVRVLDVWIGWKFNVTSTSSTWLKVSGNSVPPSPSWMPSILFKLLDLVSFFYKAGIIIFAVNMIYLLRNRPDRQTQKCENDQDKKKRTQDAYSLRPVMFVRSAFKEKIIELFLYIKRTHWYPVNCGKKIEFFLKKMYH